MQGKWTQELIAGKGADVYEPADGRPRFGILFLHGAGLESLRDRPAFTRLFDELHLACVCPEGQRSWWVDRVCAEFDPTLTAERHLLDNVLPFFEKRWQLRPPAIGLLGISMGGQGALRLAFKYPRVFPAVAAISAALDFHELVGQGTPLDDMYDSKEHARQDTAILHISPADYPPHIFFGIDPDDEDWHRGNDRLHEKLAALGIEHTADLTTQASGHSWDYFNRMAEPAIRFLYDGLEKQSRRLL
jgi:pimeloyl-ACP methyl ester carboxylesterase